MPEPIKLPATDREILLRIKAHLYDWADESVRGGWSIHLVDRLRLLAALIDRHLTTTEPSQSTVKKKVLYIEKDANGKQTLREGEEDCIPIIIPRERFLAADMMVFEDQICYVPVRQRGKHA